MKILKYIATLQITLIAFENSAQPIQKHPDNPHYFEYKNEALILITSAEHYGAVLNQQFDYETYLDTLASFGMNYTRVFSGAYVENQQSFGIEKNTLAPAENQLITPWTRSNTSGYIHGGNKFDLDSWNPQYFDRLKGFLDKASQLNIIVEFTFFSSTYNEENWKFSPLHPENNVNYTSTVERKKLHAITEGEFFDYQKQMVKKIVEEINGFDNVFFEIQNEPWADQGINKLTINPYIKEATPGWVNRVEVASKASLDWQQAIVDVIVSTEQDLNKKHLIAQNYCNFKYPLEQINEDIDIINFHYAYPKAIAWNYGWERPISFDESGFSGDDPATYRKQAWNFILSGGAVFNNLDYSFAVEYEDGSFASKKSPGGGGALLRAQLNILADFINSFDFVEMHPASHLIKHAPGVIIHGIADPGHEYAFYFNNYHQTKIWIKVPEGQYNYSWIIPATGQGIIGERTNSKNGILEIPTPEFDRDIALRIERVD